MRVTLVDVAKAAGTSASTVSRALSSPEKISAATAERIRRIAEDMGYVPVRAGKAPARGRTHVLALVVPDIANPFFPPIIKAVQARASQLGALTVIHDVDEMAVDEARVVSELVGRVDGIVLASPRSDEAFLRDLSQQVPVVMINREIEGMCSVSVENGVGVREAVAHLVRLGHRRISYLSGPRRSWSNRQRVAAIREAVREHEVELVELGPFEARLQAGMQAGDLVLSTGVTGVVAYDDVVALGVMARLRERGVAVGRQVSVVGIDGSPMSEVAVPPLTTVHVPGAQAGHEAVGLLEDLIAARASGREGRVAQNQVSIETYLVIRASTGPVEASVSEADAAG